MAKREEWIKKKPTIMGYTKLGSILPEVVAPALEGQSKQGFLEGQVKANWPNIVGKDIASKTVPQKISFSYNAPNKAILQLEVNAGEALEIQHLEPVIVEKLAVYFGYRAINGLKILQRPLT